jgi:hypothetical protein
VVWWEEDKPPKKNEAVRETIATFEQETGKQVELVLAQQEKLVADLVAALSPGAVPPTSFFTKCRLLVTSVRAGCNGTGSCSPDLLVVEI